MSLETLTELIRQYGYVAILIGTFLEGETILILGGFAAHMGYLDLPLVIASALAGSFSGDQLYFYIGRHFGPKIIARRLSWQDGAEKVYKHLHRHQNLLILTFRFFYGFRNVTPFVVGSARVSRARFFALNLIGAVVWAFSFGYAGFLFGEAFNLYIDNFQRYQMYALLALAALGLFIWLFTLLRHRRRALEHKK
ncbi:MAG TPA: DedA family protein [Candidatus Methylomirabilis sp.]|nr:DedA family protein [Candidatus Methylomirabilis sp.]